MKAVHGLLIACEIIKIMSSKIKKKKVIWSAFLLWHSKNPYSSTLGSLSLIPKTGSITRRWSSQMTQVSCSQTLTFGASDHMFDASVSVRLRVCAQPETVRPQPWGRGVLRLPPAGWEGPPGSHNPIRGVRRSGRARRPPRRRPAAGSQQLLREWPSSPWGRSFTTTSSRKRNTIIHSFKEAV